MLQRTIYLLLLLISVSCGGGANVEYTEIQGSMLGTSYHIKAKFNGVNRGGLLTQIRDLDTQMKSEMSIFDPESQLSKINRGESDELTPWIEQNIRLADSISRLSNGVYDITVAPLVKAWGFARESEQVEHPNIDSLMQFIGFEGVSIEDGRIVKRDARMQIDLNSIAKGFAVDRLADILEQNGAQNYIVDIGGEVRLKGVNPSGKAWRVGIETPIDGNMSDGELLQRRIAIDKDSPLRAVATSGNYRRFYISSEGDKIVHTIDPKTGFSQESRLLSATVLAPTCAEADAYATMLMAAGDKGAEQLAKGIENCEVYLIYDNSGESTHNGDVEYREYLSPKMQRIILE